MNGGMTKRNGILALAAALAGTVALAPVPGAAQQAVVQPIPPAALGELQAAMRVLARDPQDLRALLQAAWASLGLEDPQAALGYFRRAEAVAPANGEVFAGLATLKLREGDPIAAISLFAQAEAQGVPMARFGSDRGLALDLVGSNVAAQRYYRDALRLGSDPELVRRLALSQAISGDQRASEATLLPLLQRSDLAAYRTRAFALAILGRGEEAVSIAQTMLPATLSNRLAPYLRYMPRLTRAQQAAAANLGQFPPAAEIGRDRPEIAAISGVSAGPQVAARTPDSRLEPAGRPLGASPQPARQRDTRGPQSDDRVVVGRVVGATATPLDPPLSAQPQALPAQVGTPETEPAPRPVVVAIQEATPPRSEAPRPSLSIAEPEPALAPVEPAEPELDQAPLTEAFADFSLPPSRGAASATGAVDITTFEPPREKAEEPPPKQATPKPPAHPRRYWVQVATGRDVKALAFDWRRIKREGGDLLARRAAYTAKWGQTNRLVTGPFDSASAAQKAVSDLKAKGLDTFAFTSDEGEAVTPL